MTNGDYFRLTLTDREIAEMVGFATCAYNDRLADAFERWCEETGSVKSNQKRNNPSPFYWRRIYNEETDEWEKTARTGNVSAQLFLCHKYDEKYWR